MSALWRGYNPERAVSFFVTYWRDEDHGLDEAQLLGLQCNRALFAGPLAPDATIKQPARALFVNTTPLFEVESYACSYALIPDRTHPFGVHRPRAWATLPTSYSPIDTTKIHTLQRT